MTRITAGSLSKAPPEVSPGVGCRLDLWDRKVEVFQWPQAFLARILLAPQRAHG